MHETNLARVDSGFVDELRQPRATCGRENLVCEVTALARCPSYSARCWESGMLWANLINQTQQSSTFLLRSVAASSHCQEICSSRNVSSAVSGQSNLRY